MRDLLAIVLTRENGYAIDMEPQSHKHIRLILREETRQTHQEIDDLFSQLDLADYGDYCRFIESNFHAFSALAQHQFSKAVDAFIHQSLGALARDLEALSITPASQDKVAAPNVHGCHPTGVHYVLGGASFGKKILKKRWQRSSDRRLENAGQYISDETGQELWRLFLALPPIVSGEERSAIIESANSVFKVFEAGYHCTKNVA